MTGELRARLQGRDAGATQGVAAAGAANAPSAPWAARRLFPLLATTGLIVIGMAATTFVEPHIFGGTGWSLPGDLWGTMIAAQRLVHLNLSGLYTQPTGLVTFPGAAVILAPLVALCDVAGLALRPPGPHNGQPGLWLLAGPYMIAISAVALFAADALAERLQASRPKRALLAGAGAALLWSVSVEWGHPEDAVALGLVLFALLALSDGRQARSGWLSGLAVAVQPLVLLALPVMLAALAPRRLAPFLARAAAPAAALLGAAAAANWSATLHAVTSQPNWPNVDHPTPWTPLAPHLAGGGVAGGPMRAAAILAACGCAIIAGRGLHATRDAPRWSPSALRELLWWAAVGLALRSAFEPVMVAYYLWPALTVALVAAAASWRRLIPTSVLAVAVSVGAQSSWRSPWGWWGLMLAGLALTLLLAGVPSRRAPGGSRGRRPAAPAGRPLAPIPSAGVEPGSGA